MKRLAWLFGVPFMVWLVWTQLVQPTYEHRFRVTLEVDTPEGPRRGSSVWSVTCTEPAGGPLRQLPTGGCNLRGEAVVVDLPNGRHLIGLMATGPRAEGVNLYEIARQAFAFDGGSGEVSWFSQAPKWAGTRPLDPPLIPTLVTFTDITDPASARVVYATAYDGITTAGSYYGTGIVPINDFSYVLGPGYAFKRATLGMVPVGIWPLNLIGITGEPVTRGIEGKLPAMMVKLRELDKSLQLVHPNDPLKVRSGHLSVR
jgi:hypothetical protein